MPYLQRFVVLVFLYVLLFVFFVDFLSTFLSNFYLCACITICVWKPLFVTGRFFSGTIAKPHG